MAARFLRHPRAACMPYADRISRRFCDRGPAVIENCTVSGGTISSTSTDENFRAGGIAGYSDGTITGCTNYGEVSATGYAGGIVCWNGGTVSADCTNKGKVMGEYARDINGND